MKHQIDHATIEPRGPGAFRVYLWGVYGEHSVLAGQTLRAYFVELPTEAECRAALAASVHANLPVELLDRPSGKPHVSTAHLPGEDDPVPGGMYPDDIGEWPPLP